MRLITKKEGKKASKIFANIFNEYDLYDLIFKRDKNMEKKIYYFFSFEVFSAINFTYEFDDFKAIASIKKPGDKETNPYKYLLLKPGFVLGFLFWTNRKAAKIALNYMDYAEEVAKKYYNPETDCYIKNIGVVKEYRNQGYLRRMIDEICGDKPIYLETHDAKNVEIYKKLGFVLLEESDFMGKIHYAMKRF